MVGSVTFIKSDKGFAFVTPDGASPDERGIFLHVNDCDPSIAFDDSLRGRRLEFDVVMTEKGRAAKNVRAEDAEPAPRGVYGR